MCLTIKDRHQSEKCLFCWGRKAIISLYILGRSILFLPLGISASTLTPLQLTQNAGSLVFSLHKFFKITPLLSALHWHPVAAHIQFKAQLLAYKATEGRATACLQIMIQPYSLTLSFCFAVPPFSAVNNPLLCPVLTLQPRLGSDSSPLWLPSGEVIFPPESQLQSLPIWHILWRLFCVQFTSELQLCTQPDSHPASFSQVTL